MEFNAIIVNEPRLRFGNDRAGAGLNAHPMKGLVQFGPYDGELVREERCGELRIGVIAPKKGEAELSAYLRQLQNPHAAVEIKAEYLVQYPGFQKAFRLPLNLPAVGNPAWRTLPAITLNASQLLTTQKAIIAAIEREVEASHAPIGRSGRRVRLHRRQGPRQFYLDRCQNVWLALATNFLMPVAMAG